MNCNTTISATLDLTQAIKNFEQTIAAQISLSDVCQWDGRTICEREEKIRQAALILAGQCMALLLHKLSESRVAQTTASKQTQGWRHPNSKGNGRVEAAFSGGILPPERCLRQVICLGNVVVCLRLPYVVERSKQPRSLRRRSRGQGFCPFLRWLCMEEGITPLVWSTVASIGTVSASFAIARASLLRLGDQHKPETG